MKRGVSPSYQMTSTLGPFTNAALQAQATGNATDLRLTAMTISRFPEIVIARKELWQDFDRMLGLVARDSSQSFSDAAAAVRGRAKKFGRRPSDRVVGTPLLVKGLEFDHVLVMNAQQLSREELYVSLTRAQTSLTVMSPRPILPPP